MAAKIRRRDNGKRKNVGPRSKRYPPASTAEVRPPTRGSRSMMVTLSPAWANRRALANPPGPAPTIVTFLDINESARIDFDHNDDSRADSGGATGDLTFFIESPVVTPR